MVKLSRSAFLFMALLLVLSCSACSTSSQPESDSSQSDVQNAGTVGSNSPEDGKTTLTMIHEHTNEAASTVASSRMFLKVQNDFLDENPNVNLDVTALGSGEVFERLSVLAAANELPDIVYMSRTIFLSIVGDNMLADLSEYLDADNYRDKLSTFSNEGKIYAVPTKYTTYDYVYYNSELWKEAGYEEFPDTWKEVLEAGEKFKSEGITPISFGNKLTWCAPNCYLNALAYELCGNDWAKSILANDGKAAYTDDGFINALNELKKLTVLWNADFNTADDQWAVAELVKGKAATHISGSWVAGSIMSYENDYPGISEKIRVAKVPTLSGEAPVIDYAVPQGVGINSSLEGTTSKFEAAITFIQFIGSDRYSKYMADVGEMGPVEVEINKDSLLPMQADMFHVMNGNPNEAAIGAYVSAKVSTAISASVSSFLSGTISAEECAAAIQSSVSQ